MKVVLALLCLGLPLSGTLAQAPTPSPTPINLNEYTAKLNEFASLAIVGVVDLYLESYTLTQACEKSPALAKTQFAKTQTLNILRELEAFEQITTKAYRSARATSAGDKPILSPLSGEKWAEGEQERIASSYYAQKKETEQKIARCIGIMQRQASMPMGLQFSMALDDPLLLALDAEKDRITKGMKAEQLRKAYPPVEMTINQVLKTGCTVRIQIGRYDSKDAFVEGLVGPNVAEDQTYKLPIVPDGVYSYTTVFGASRTIEKYKVLKIED